MQATKRGVNEKYVLSGREFTGTREEILLQLDELIETLAAWRQSLVCSNETSGPRHVWWLGTKQGAW